MRRWVGALLVPAMVSLAACTDHGWAMREGVAPAAPRSSDGRARVTFRCPDCSRGQYRVVYVADEAGLLGMLTDQTEFAVQIAPGPHELYAWTESRLGVLGVPKITAARARDLGADRSYVVDLVVASLRPSSVKFARPSSEGALRELVVDEDDLARIGRPPWLAARLARGRDAARDKDLLVIDAD